MSLTKVSFSMIEGAPFNILHYGADPTGSADSTTAILDAVAAGGSNCSIYFPTGTYKVTSQILISSDRVHIYGDGAYATTIMFAPTANSTLFKFEQAGTTINQGSVRDLAIRSDDNTYVKYALHFIDISGYYVSNVVIGGGVAIGSAKAETLLGLMRLLVLRINLLWSRQTQTKGCHQFSSALTTSTSTICTSGQHITHALLLRQVSLQPKFLLLDFRHGCLVKVVFTGLMQQRQARPTACRLIIFGTRTTAPTVPISSILTQLPEFRTYKLAEGKRVSQTVSIFET